MENRIVVILHGNEDMVTLGTTAKLCDYQYTFSPPADDELSKRFLSFRNRMRNVPGVKGIDIGKHEVRIERYEAFMWNEIIPAAAAVLAKYAKFAEYVTRVRDDRPSHFWNEDGDPMGHRFHEPVDTGLPDAVPFMESAPAVAA